jgi:acetate kinase
MAWASLSAEAHGRKGKTLAELSIDRVQRPAKPTPQNRQRALLADPAAAKGRVVLAHLRSGASLCAVLDGKSVETSTSFTATAGVPMSTRSGDPDPGLCIGAFAAVLGGVDRLVFAGGIGENSPVIRARICDGLGFLGLRLENERNAKSAQLISDEAGSVAVSVIRTDEEHMIAKAVCRVLDSRCGREN